MHAKVTDNFRDSEINFFFTIGLFISIILHWNSSKWMLK